MSAGRALMGEEKNSVQGLLRKTLQKTGDPKYEKMNKNQPFLMGKYKFAI